MSIVSYEDYFDNPNLQRERSTRYRNVSFSHPFDTVFEQYELDVPCYDNDTSEPQLVSATLRPINELFQIPGVAVLNNGDMQRGTADAANKQGAGRFSSGTPRWQEGVYGSTPDEEYIHTIYVTNDLDEQSGYSPNCVYEEHYVFDVFERPEESSNRSAEYQGDSDWKGPIITEVTDSDDEKGPSDESEGGDASSNHKPRTDPQDKPKAEATSNVSAVNAGTEGDMFSRDLLGNGKTSMDVAPTGSGSLTTGLKATTTSYNQELVIGEEELLRRQRDYPNQLSVRASSLNRRPLFYTLPPHLYSPAEEILQLTNTFEGAGAPPPMAFTINEGFDPYAASLVLNSLSDPAQELAATAAASFPYNQRQALIANQMAAADPYGDGILTAISHHNKLVDQFPPGSTQYFHRGQPDVRFYQETPKRFVPPSAAAAAAERARRIKEQQRLQNLRRAGLIPTQLRHAGVQPPFGAPPPAQQPYVAPQHNEFLSRQRDFYRPSNDPPPLLEDVYQERRRRAPFDRVNVTVSARPHAGRFVDETTEVLEKLNDIYQYVLTKPTAGQVKTKIEEVHQSVHSRDVDDFFSLSGMTDFIDYSVKGGKLKPIHLKPQRKQAPTAGPTRPAVPHGVRLMNERPYGGFFGPRAFQRPPRGHRIPNVDLGNVEYENCFEF